ncbi:MAG: ATP synthase F1 subunit delta [Bacilli bacterium]|mgnify:FL=1|nr:ATP synthase F1 subunit delta [Bacilli bacterium]
MNEIASRYGTALFSLALERNKLSEYQMEVKELKRILLENGDFIMVLGSSFETIENRIAIAEKTFKGVNQDILSLINILIENNRINEIIDVFTCFNSCCNEYRGVDEGLVYSTVSLDEQVINKIEKQISKIESRDVELINKIDPSLIGGVKVVINGHIYDGSIKNRIDLMKVDLLKKEEKPHEN